MAYCPIHTTIALEPKRRGWYCEECGQNVLTFDQFPLPVAAPALPPLISGPFDAMAMEKHSFVWLWTACEAVEALLKFLVVAGIAERSAGGVLPEALAAEIQPRIDRPSIGQWAHMLRVLTATQPESKLLPELKAVFRQIEEILTGVAPGDRNPATSFLSLRNQLAHGGIGSRHEELRSRWEPALVTLRQSLAPLAELQIVVQGEDGAWLTMGPEGLLPFIHPELLSGKMPSPLYAVRGETVVSLWPLGLFDAPVGLDDSAGVQPTLQLYLRRDKEDLHYLPLQVDTPLLSKSGRQALEAFHSLFPAKPPRKAKVAGFEDEIRKDADERVGRDAELQRLRDWVERPNPEQKGRSLWIAGIAGMGKSVLVASLVQELQEERKNVLAYRFRSGDPRCNWASFCTFLDECLSRPDPEPFSVNQRDQAKDRIRERVYRASSREPLILVLDGIDEIHRSDADFVRHFLKPLASVDGLTLVCAGRPDEGLPEMFHHLPAEFAFDGGLPPLAADQVKAILLERLERRGLRKRLIEQGSQDNDAFVGAVTRNAAGLPIYVRYAVNDVLGGKLRVLDAQDARALPPSLNEYYQRIVRDYGLGTDAQIRLEIFYLLAVACCPLNAATLAEFCVRLQTIGGEFAEPPEERVRRAISALSPMLQMSLVDGEAPSYALYHDSFRQHLATDAATRDSLAGMHRRIGTITMEWQRDHQGPVSDYVVRHGVAHLLAVGDTSAAERRLLDIHYMAALCRAAEVFVIPLQYWNQVGLDGARSGYLNSLGSLGDADATVVGDVGNFLGEAGLYDAAEPLVRRALESQERTLGREHPKTLHSVNNLAMLLDLKGDYAAAQLLCRRVLDTREQTLGPEHPDTFQSINSLANVLVSKGDYSAAEPLYRQALEGRERILGPEHRDTLQSMGNLALLLAKKRDYSGAEPLYRQALEGRERTLGPENPDTLMTVYNFAIFLYHKGDAIAEPLIRRALQSRERVLGPEHPETLQSVNCLATLLGDKGDYDAAESLHRRALKALERTLGPEHPKTLVSVNNLATLLHDKKDYDTAESLHRRALETLERTLGSDHPQVLHSIHNLASLLHAKRDYTEAHHFSRWAAEARGRILGPEHPVTLGSLINLASLLNDIGDYSAAEPIFRRAIEATERTLGQEHPLTLQSTNGLAMLLHAKGDYYGAEPFFRRILDVRERTLGREHPKTLLAVNNLAAVLLRMNDPNSASALLSAWAERCVIRPVTLFYNWSRSECLLGRRDRASDLITAYLEVHPEKLITVLKSPDLEPLHDWLRQHYNCMQ